jgi:hypothetical protein
MSTVFRTRAFRQPFQAGGKNPGNGCFTLKTLLFLFHIFVEFQF